MIARSKSGFTLVELMIVIVVIAILASVTVVSYGSIQADSRDNVRSIKIYAIASALEDYYQIHGDYPGCPALTTDGQTVVSNTLTSLGQPDALVAPQAAAGVTNSITCESLSSVPTTTDAFVYTGNTSSDCRNSTFCRSWILQVRAESGDLITERSLHVSAP